MGPDMTCDNCLFKKTQNDMVDPCFLCKSCIDAFGQHQGEMYFWVTDQISLELLREVEDKQISEFTEYLESDLEFQAFLEQVKKDLWG